VNINYRLIKFTVTIIANEAHTRKSIAVRCGDTSSWIAFINVNIKLYPKMKNKIAYIKNKIYIPFVHLSY
jgi:hypothetical protein